MLDSDRNSKSISTERVTLSWLAKQKPKINSARVSKSIQSSFKPQGINIVTNNLDKEVSDTNDAKAKVSGLFSFFGNKNVVKNEETKSINDDNSMLILDNLILVELIF